MTALQRQPHSAEWINDSRYEWWNRDFLNLMRQRIGLGTAETVLDVGIGAGHWSSLFLDVPGGAFDLTGVDLETHWLLQAEETLSRHHGIAQFHPVAGLAQALPLPDNSFDLVTCQTVLMHCTDPQTALKELIRATKPGGWIVASEPVNTLNRIVFSDTLALIGPAKTACLVKLWSSLEEGRRITKDIDNNIGSKLCGMFELNGLSDCKIFQNDRLWKNTYPDENAFEQNFRELQKPDHIEFIKAAGCTEQDIQEAWKCLHDLKSAAAEYKGSFTQLSPLILTIGRKG
jgi:ubiquinone/menaquinone biosynthesis C-methylase UbiE